MPTPAPLDGIRVLDLSAYAAGPVTAQTLASLGADVIKVERPPKGDPERGLWDPMFQAHNRGKASIMLALDDPGDRAVFDFLLAGADVVVENFRPAVAQRLKATFADLSTARPGLIQVSLPGFAPGSPAENTAAYEPCIRSLTGEIALMQESSPQAAGTDWTLDYPVYGYVAASNAVIAVLGALLKRDPAGAHIVVPLLAAGRWWTYAARQNPIYRRAGHPAVTRVYDTADNALVVMASLPDQFAALCEITGCTTLLSDPLDGTLAWQEAHASEVSQALAAAFLTAGRDHWLGRLQGRGVPAAPVVSVQDADSIPEALALVDSGIPGPADGLPVGGLAQRPIGRIGAPGADGDGIRRDGWGYFAPRG
jgi:crotonobetainyl-CoA:carnitine CoA-transferase CaiB-like acyl-CoA transferase